MTRMFGGVVALPVLSCAWLAVGVGVAGAMYPGYNHLTQFISELGATGSPVGSWVNWWVFFACEVPVLVFVWQALRRLPHSGLLVAGLVLLALYALLLMAAAVFPCDFGCRADDPTTSHQIHMLTGVSAYLAGLAGLLAVSLGLGRMEQRIPRLAFVLPVASVLLLGVSGTMPDYAGLGQRLNEGLIYAWMIAVAVRIERLTTPSLP
ncbi:DUF998 domain-containing protein [Pannonibacter carbonis]|uniref:DUF998 domain-containing protein n=1 Tax=Pannonibacter carbonis TaxID=2067569 RepID=UPI000D1062C1|nr:DUF998 domain-containing protein [Pannonibacter carbonis]